MIWLFLLAFIPLFTAFGSWFIPRQRIAEFFHILGSFLLLVNGIVIFIKVLLDGPILGCNDYLYVDSLSAFFIFIFVIVAFTASIYAVGYFRYEVEQKTLALGSIDKYYASFHLFLFTISLVMILNNLALVWIAIELTTLASALLIAFYRTGRALEAAWKYLIIGSLGISFALFGVLFLYASGLDIIGETHDALNWTVLYSVAAELDPTWIMIAFIFVLVGYGTKAGFAPLHFWLPDAHSEAPSPVSAVLSGVLLNTALYGIVRVYLIVHKASGGGADKWLIGFGLFSIALMVPFILVQQDYKRMLAYSSVEHIGVITFGIGIGGPLGLYGAMLHMFNHSMVKSLLFMTAGNISQKFKSKEINQVTGLLKVMPITGFAFMLAILTIAGAPPFNIFVSEWTIMLAGFKENHIGLTILFIAFILLIFAGMTFYMSRMVFGDPERKITHGETNRWSTAALFIPLAIIPIFGIYVPTFMDQTIQNIVTLFQGG